MTAVEAAMGESGGERVTVRARLGAGIRFDAEAADGAMWTLDAGPELGGAHAGLSPMEALLASLAGCLGITITDMLRRMRREVAAYTITVRGTRATTHPRVYVAIAVEHRLAGTGLRREAVERAVALAEERYCPVSAMLGRAVPIVHTIVLDEPPARSP